MKAAICRRYGPPSCVTIEEVAQPVPSPGEVLVAVEAAGLTTGDAGSAARARLAAWGR